MMNDLDDYDFGSAENSNLSSIFGRDQLFEPRDNSLVYRAPKQPIANPQKLTTPTSFYKYINLHETVGTVEQRLGKHIIALLKSDTNCPDVLIYQNKKNIFIRSPITNLNISKYAQKKYCLFIFFNTRSFLLEYNSEDDYREFISEFSNSGGTINEQKSEVQEIKEKKSLPILSEATVLTNLANADSTIFEPIEETDGNNLDETQNQKEKEGILARLAKMGLPQLPSFGNETTKKDSQNDITEKAEKISINSENKSIIREDEARCIESNYQIAKFNPDFTPSGSNNYQLQTLNTSLDPIALMLAENRINNAELRHHMSLLTSNINKPNSEENRTDNQLRSKLRAFQMKSENLETELNELKNKYQDLLKVNEELSREMRIENEPDHVNESKKENSCSNCDFHKSHVKLLLSFLQDFPVKTSEIDLNKLRNIIDRVKDEELISVLELMMSSIENKIELHKLKFDGNMSLIRTDFIKGMKRIMNNFYVKLSNSIENENLSDVLEEEIKLMTLGLIHNYDGTVTENVKSCF